MRRTALLLTLFCWACDSPATIDVEPKRPLLTNKDDRLQLKATVKDEQGKALAGAKVSFKSLTPTMASVDALGSVQAITSGTAAILVQSGSATKQVEVLIQIAKKIKIEPDSPMMMVGVTKRFKATVIDDRDQPMIAGKIRWASSDPTIFSVDSYGDVKTIKEGTAKLTAHAPGISDSTEITVKHEELSEDGTLSQ